MSKNRNNINQENIDNKIFDFKDISDFAYENNCYIVLETMTKNIIVILLIILKKQLI